METRIKKRLLDINYQETKRFFDGRVAKYNQVAPYTVTSYQDANPDLAMARDGHEKEVIFPLLGLTQQDKVIDIGCGIGRWGDFLADKVAGYLGTDFSEPLLDLASKRIATQSCAAKIHFQCIAMQDLWNIHPKDFLLPPPFSCAIIGGVMSYINDVDILRALEKLPRIMSNSSFIYIREPIAVETRLTLDKHYSSELGVEYSVIYRTADEYSKFFEQTLYKEGYKLKMAAPMLTQPLSNRLETSQYYFLLKREYEGKEISI